MTCTPCQADYRGACVRMNHEFLKGCAIFSAEGTERNGAEWRRGILPGNSTLVPQYPLPTGRQAISQFPNFPISLITLYPYIPISPAYRQAGNFHYYPCFLNNPISPIPTPLYLYTSIPLYLYTSYPSAALRAHFLRVLCAYQHTSRTNSLPDDMHTVPG